MEAPAWTYEGLPVTDETVTGFAAFVYRVTNVATGKAYIGKKVLTRKITRKPLKGKTRKRHSEVESDWRTYWGSSNSLAADIEHIGHEGFRREILILCRTRGESSYHEARLQMEHRVLESDAWYNDSIRVRVHRGHLPKNKKKN